MQTENIGSCEEKESAASSQETGVTKTGEQAVEDFLGSLNTQEKKELLAVLKDEHLRFDISNVLKHDNYPVTLDVNKHNITLTTVDAFQELIDNLMSLGFKYPTHAVDINDDGVSVSIRVPRSTTVHVTCGSIDWEPTAEELGEITRLFMATNEDPVGAIIATRPGLVAHDLPTFTDVDAFPSTYRAPVYRLGHHLMPGIGYNTFPVTNLFCEDVAGLFWHTLISNRDEQWLIDLIEPATDLKDLLNRIDTLAPGQCPFIALALGGGDYDVAYRKQSSVGDVWEVAPLVRSQKSLASPYSNLADTVPQNICGVEAIRASSNDAQRVSKS